MSKLPTSGVGRRFTAAKEFDQELKNIQTALARGGNAIVANMLPRLVELTKYIRSTVLPAWQDFKTKAMVPGQSIYQKHPHSRFHVLH